MDTEKPIEIMGEWPTVGLGGNGIFFEDISGRSQTMEINSQRMFVDSSSINVETCTIDVSGELLLNIYQ